MRNSWFDVNISLLKSSKNLSYACRIGHFCRFWSCSLILKFLFFFGKLKRYKEKEKRTGWVVPANIFYRVEIFSGGVEIFSSKIEIFSRGVENFGKGLKNFQLVMRIFSRS